MEEKEKNEQERCYGNLKKKKWKLQFQDLQSRSGMPSFCVQFEATIIVTPFNKNS